MDSEFIPILAAVISAAASITVASVLAFRTERLKSKLAGELERLKSDLADENNTKLEKLKSDLADENNTKLEKLKNSLEIDRTQQAAFRDYQYEAKKRLYHQFEPLLFLLSEYSESSLIRIYNLSLLAKKGKLDATKGLLADYGKSYYGISTVYRLLLPMVIFKLMQQKLTLFDLDLVQLHKTQYFFAKFLRSTFQEVFTLADANPRLIYKPSHYDYLENEKYAEQTRRHGVPIGKIDNMLEELIMYDNNGSPQILSYGDFEKKFFEPDVKKPFIEIAHIFHKFHPKSSPVLWRILIMQAHVCLAIKKAPKMKEATTIALADALKPMSLKDRRKYFDWRQVGEDVSDDEVLVQPFDALEDYFRMYFSEYVEGSA